MLTYRVDKHFIREGMALWTSFVLLRQPNTEVFSYECDELGDSSLDLILVKTKGLDCVPTFIPQKTEGLNILLFPTLSNTELQSIKHRRLQSVKHRRLWFVLDILFITFSGFFY